MLLHTDLVDVIDYLLKCSVTDSNLFTVAVQYPTERNIYIDAKAAYEMPAPQKIL